ncbi:MAG TPA: FecR domain-containing protein, partial [Steroidobacter sp.]
RWMLAAGVAMACLVLAIATHLMWRDPSYATQLGEQRTVRLDDGSRISLNSLSRLVVEYSGSQRRVRLEEGEAFFEVTTNPSRPFVVAAGGSEVTAVGTTFTVRYEPDRLAVVLVEGKVLVSTPSHASVGQAASQVTLLPGERLILSAQSPAQVDKPRAGSVAAWRRGEIVLDKTTLAEAVREMNRYDQTRLLIDDDAVGRLLVGGIFRTGDNLAFARAMAELHHLRLVREDGQIRLQRGDARRVR